MIPEWFKVTVGSEPDSDGNLNILLDYHDCTFETRISPAMAYRLAESLVTSAEAAGLPGNFSKMLRFERYGD